MGIQFSQLYIVDEAILGFHDLSPRQQRLVIEIRTSTVECMTPLQCPYYPFDKIVVHTSFKGDTVHNTLVLCCPGFQATVRAALGSCTFECSCICLVGESDPERDY
jgi:hypothetical protein